MELLMTPLTFELAHRTATTAVPFVESLARDYSDVAQTLRLGRLDEALDAFDASADRLQRFLTFLVVASELMVDTAPTAGAFVADYNRRLFGLLDRVHDALNTKDLVALTMVLEHGLSKTLLEYRKYAQDVEVAFAPRAVA